MLKNLYWKSKGELALRMNLDVLKEQVSEVGEALPEHSTYLGNTLFLRGDKSEYISFQDETLIHNHFPGIGCMQKTLKIFIQQLCTSYSKKFCIFHKLN